MLAVGVAAALLGGCGSGSDGASRVTAGLIERGAAEMRDGTVRIRAAMTRDAGSGEVRTFRLEGSRDGERDSSEMRSTDGMPPGTTETRTIGVIAYQRFAGTDRWLRLPPLAMNALPGALPDLTNPFSFLDQLRNIARIETLGPGEVDGIPVTRCRVTLDMKALMKRVPPEYRDLYDPPSESSVVYKVLVDEQGRVRRLKGASVSTRITMRYDVEFYDFGADIHIEAPPASDVVDGDAAAVLTAG